MRIERTRAAADVDAAAQIWAEATAARDGEDEFAELADSRPIIQSVLDRSPRSLLLLARNADGVAVGFAVAAPAAMEPAAVAPAAIAPTAAEPAAELASVTAELCYFGVSPRRWGQGVGERLLRELPGQLTSAEFTHAQLSVYVDNARATTLYEWLGWLACGDPTPHPRTRKPERRYQLGL